LVHVSNSAIGLGHLKTNFRKPPHILVNKVAIEHCASGLRAKPSSKICAHEQFSPPSRDPVDIAWFNQKPVYTVLNDFAVSAHCSRH